MDEIADKVASQVISALPEVNVDTDYIGNAISERLIENQADRDYDIVLDEDNLERVAVFYGSYFVAHCLAHNVITAFEHFFDFGNLSVYLVKAFVGVLGKLFGNFGYNFVAIGFVFGYGRKRFNNFISNFSGNFVCIINVFGKNRS